jgi:hypothetical protein
VAETAEETPEHAAFTRQPDLLRERILLAAEVSITGRFSTTPAPPSRR